MTETAARRPPRPTRRALLLTGSAAALTVAGCTDLGRDGGDDEDGDDGSGPAAELRASECRAPEDFPEEELRTELEDARDELEDGAVTDPSPAGPDSERRLDARVLSVSPDGALLIAREAWDRAALGLVEDAGALIWETATGALYGRLPVGGGTIAWHPDGDRLAVAGELAVDIVDQEGAPLQHLLGHWPVDTGLGELIAEVASSADGEWLASRGIDGSVRLWRDPGAACEVGEVLDLRDIYPQSLAFGPEGTLLAVAGEKGPIRLYDLEQSDLVEEIDAGDTYISPPLFSPDGSLFWSAAGEGGLRVRATDGSTRTVPGPEGYEPSSFVAAAYGRIAMISAPGDIVAVWDPETDEVEELTGAPTTTERLVWSPDATVLYALSTTDGVVAWDGAAWQGFELPG